MSEKNTRNQQSKGHTLVSDFSAIVQIGPREAFAGRRGAATPAGPTSGLPGTVDGRQTSRGGRAGTRSGVCELYENTQLLSFLFCTQSHPCRSTPGSSHKQLLQTSASGPGLRQFRVQVLWYVVLRVVSPCSHLHLLKLAPRVHTDMSTQQFS